MTYDLLVISSFLQRADKKLLFAQLSNIFEDHNVFNFIKEYYIGYGEFPSQEIIELETSIDLPYPTAPFEFYIKKLKESAIHTKLMEINTICSPLLDASSDKYDPSGACDRLFHHVLAIQKIKHDGLIDFSQSGDLLFNEIKSLNESGALLKTGYTKLDDAVNGIFIGDLVSIVARLNMGKTYIMLWLANHIWHMYKIPILFISLEMPRQRIFQRLLGLNTKIPVEKIITGSLSKKEWSICASAYKKLTDMATPFYVYHDYKARIEDVYTHAQYSGAKVIFVDGAYLLKTQKYMPKIEKYGLIAEELKSYALGLNVPLFASWQLNRSAETTKEITAANIAYADEIGQLSSIVLSIEYNNELDKNIRRRLNVLKGRDGSLSNIIINWKFDPIDFTEWSNDLTNIDAYI